MFLLAFNSEQLTEYFFVVENICQLRSLKCAIITDTDHLKQKKISG